MIHGTSTIRRTAATAWAALALSATGCTSALSTAYLRDALWSGDGHAAEAGATAGDDRAPAESAPLPESADTGAADADRRAAAIDEAVARLAKLDGIDDETRAALLATLETTQQEDWPVVIETFAESLGPRRPTVADTAPPADAPAGTADTDTARAAAAPPAVEQIAEEAEPAALIADVEPAPVEVVPVTVPAPAPNEPPATPPPAIVPVAAPKPVLSVRNACFARRVVAWGDVDRFPVSRFQPGQDVIVYFELDDLSAGVSPAGHTTCVDTALRLVAADGTQLHAWTFEPLAETRQTPRRDYFARYVVKIPEAMPVGPCRIEVAVTDTLANATASALLPLEIVE